MMIDDDSTWCFKMIEHLAACPYFDVMDPVHSGETAIERIEAHRPDAIILDIVLPVNDGLHIIDYIDTQMHGYRPVVYVMSMFNTAKINWLLSNYDIVDYYSVKPVNPKTATDALRHILTCRLGDQDVYAEGLDFSRSFAGLDLIVEDYLRKLGIGTASLQTKCMRVAIEILMQADKSVRVGMMDLYKQVGQQFTPPMTMAAVERHIRAGVANIKKKHTSHFEACFPNHGITINSGVFVNESANILQRKLRETGNGTVLGKQNSELSR